MLPVVCHKSPQQTYRMSQIGLKSVQNDNKNKNSKIPYSLYILGMPLKESLNLEVLVSGFLSVIHLTLKM